MPGGGEGACCPARKSCSCPHEAITQTKRAQDGLLVRGRSRPAFHLVPLTKGRKLLAADHGLHLFLIALLERLDQVVIQTGGVLESLPHRLLDFWASGQCQPEASGQAL